MVAYFQMLMLWPECYLLYAIKLSNVSQIICLLTSTSLMFMSSLISLLNSQISLKYLSIVLLFFPMSSLISLLFHILSLIVLHVSSLIPRFFSLSSMLIPGFPPWSPWSLPVFSLSFQISSMLIPMMIEMIFISHCPPIVFLCYFIILPFDPGFRPGFSCYSSIIPRFPLVFPLSSLFFLCFIHYDPDDDRD